MWRFEEISVIGDGAFGIVTKCRDKETGKFVAIKKMKQKFSNFEECLQLKEVKSLRKFKHENVMRMLQIFREKEHLYLVFELLDKSLLKTMEEKQSTFSEAEIRYIIHQILCGLQYIHKQGFFHRDIKPDNLLWSGSNLKLADFGLAREIRSRPPYTEYVSTRWYRAPEIILRDQFYNSPVDLWATGCIMAELYMGRPIFPGNSESDQIYKICSVLGSPNTQNWPDVQHLLNRSGLRLPNSSPIPLSKLIPNASSEALNLISDLLRYDPSKRLSATQALNHPYFKGEMQAPKVNEQVKQQLFDLSSIRNKGSSITSSYENGLFDPTSDSELYSCILGGETQASSQRTMIKESHRPLPLGRNTQIQKPSYGPSRLGNLLSNRYNIGAKQRIVPGFVSRPMQRGHSDVSFEGSKDAKSGFNLDDDLFDF